MAEQNPKKPRLITPDCVKSLNPQIIREAILSEVDEPLVFRGYLTGKWKCLDWDAKDWGKVLGDDELVFRIGERVKDHNLLKSPQWESECVKDSMKYRDFLEWINGQKVWLTKSNIEVDSSNYWAYFDYFYMKNLKHPDQLEENIDWGLFGFVERGLVDSTLWIGSTGANTPCHIDTYGCNLVAQVTGKKRWVLFPRSQSEYLSPTRVPYEESSIYSDVSFPRPDVRLHPRIVSTTPYVVTLEPGDVLFVPNQWWHSVENLEFAISVNTWIELPSDDEERVKEAIVMHQVGSLCQGIESVELISSAFNPNMMNVATMISTDLLNLLVNKVFQTDSGKVAIKAQKDKTDKHAEKFDWKDEGWCLIHNICKVEKLSFERYYENVLRVNLLLQDINPHENKKVLSGVDGELQFSQLKLLIDTFTDPRVINQVKKVLDEKLDKPM